MRLARIGWNVQGCVIADEAVAEARRRSAAAGLAIPFRALDVLSTEDVYQPSDLVVCCEVMEHLEDPTAALDVLAKLSKHFLILSVPREPLWRFLNMARGIWKSDVWGKMGVISFDLVGRRI